MNVTLTTTFSGYTDFPPSPNLWERERERKREKERFWSISTQMKKAPESYLRKTSNSQLYKTFFFFFFCISSRIDFPFIWYISTGLCLLLPPSSMIIWNYLLHNLNYFTLLKFCVETWSQVKNLLNPPHAHNGFPFPSFWMTIHFLISLHHPYLRQ